MGPVLRDTESLKMAKDTVLNGALYFLIHANAKQTGTEQQS